MNRLAILIVTVFVAMLLSGAFALCGPDPEQPTADMVDDANAQDAVCAKSPHTCERDAEEAAKDPRVQSTLRRLCSQGSGWACTLSRPVRPLM